MSRSCSICSSRNRLTVDRQLRAGDPLTKIAAEHNVSRHALQRHTQHVQPENDLAAKWDDLRTRAEEIEQAMAATGDGRSALVALGEQGRALAAVERLRSSERNRQTEGFEDWSPDRQLHWLLKTEQGQVLARAYLDHLVTDLKRTRSTQN